MKTVADTVSNDGDFVASFAEAWIEKIYTYRKIGKKWSPPSRRRGLKTCKYSAVVVAFFVASFAEAWIEKLIKLMPFSSMGSPPSRRRGLKRLRNPTLPNPLFVASFAEAWIENRWFVRTVYILAVASFAEAWIENHDVTHLTVQFLVASFAEAWIENSNTMTESSNAAKSPPSRRRGLKIDYIITQTKQMCRLLRGGVD